MQEGEESEDDGVDAPGEEGEEEYDYDQELYGDEE